MHSAAREPAEDPAPDPAELQARVAAVCAEHQAVIAEIRSMRKVLAASACDPQIAAMLSERLRLVAAATFDAGTHAEEMRSEMARYAAVESARGYRWEDGREAGFEEGWKACEATRRAPEVPRQRGGRHGGQSRQGWLVKVVDGGKPGVIPGAAAFWAAARASRHALAHPAAITAHTARLAAMSAAGTAAAATAAVIVLAPGITHAGPGMPGPSAAAPAATVEGAVRAPGESPAALSVLHPKARRHGRKAPAAAAGAGAVPPSAPLALPSSSPAASPSAVVTSAAGPASLSVSAASLDLSGPSATASFTVSATGGGWASWSVSTTGTDLVFSPDHGVLAAGFQATVTVSLAPSLDGLARQVFEVAGQSVTVSLPVPALLPSSDPSATDTPPVLPSLPGTGA